MLALVSNRLMLKKCIEDRTSVYALVHATGQRMNASNCRRFIYLYPQLARGAEAGCPVVSSGYGEGILGALG